MSGHTPSPWVECGSSNERVYVAGDNGSIIAFIESDDEMVAADASLIAAAPELLEALEAMYEMFNGQGAAPEDDDAIIAARAAIAKARGEQP